MAQGSLATFLFCQLGWFRRDGLGTEMQKLGAAGVGPPGSCQPGRFGISTDVFGVAVQC